jgi:hypothetical protein
VCDSLGLTPADVTADLASMTHPRMITLGPVPNTSLAEYRVSVSRPPRLLVKNSHRFELALSTPHVRPLLKKL